MRNIKRRLPLIPLYDHTTMEKQLEHMAESGWMLDRITNCFWQYRRIEPKKIHFTVTYYLNASVFDPTPSEGEQSFQAYCAEAGWHVAATSAKLQIFYNEQEFPVPIETDSVLQVQTIHKAVKFTYLLPYFLLIGNNFYLFHVLLSRFRETPIEFLASIKLITVFFNAILIFLFCFNGIFGYYFWYYKAKKSAKREGIFVETHSLYRLSNLFIGLALLNYILLSLFSCSRSLGILILLFSCLLIVMIFVLITVINLLKRKQVDTATNLSIYILLTVVLSFSIPFVISSFLSHATNHHWFEREPVKTYEYAGDTWNIYHDTLPLTIEDLEEVDYPDYSYECNVEETVFLTHSSYRQMAKLNDRGIPNLKYSSTDFKMPFLYHFCLQSIFKDTEETALSSDWAPHFKKVNPSLWEADAAYQKYYGKDPSPRYLLCYPDRLVTISLDEPPTLAQMSVIGEKLTGIK